MKQLYISALAIILSLTTIHSIAQTAKLNGTITDAVTNEPIPFANIAIAETNIYSTSDIEGNFIFTGLNPGYIKLMVKYIGYDDYLSDDILLTNNNVPNISIKLKSSDTKIDDVIIKAKQLSKQEEAPLSMQSISTGEIESNPGSNRDISRVIQSFPGVGSTPAFRNDIIIRGGGPSESRFFLDDVEIPVLNHFSTQGASGGPVGIINADFIRSVNFYSGSFPADKYNALSGILDFKLKDGSSDKTNLQFALGASETSLTLDGPIGKKTNYIFSVRRSYLQFLFNVIGLPFLPNFTDYQLKVKSALNKKNTLEIISLGALDKNVLNLEIKNPDEQQQYILANIPVNNQWSYVFGVVYKHFTDNGYFTFVGSRNMLNNQFYKYPDNDETKPKSLNYNSTEAENKLRAEYEYNKNGLKISASISGEYAEYSNTTSQQIFIYDSLINFNYSTNLHLYKYGSSLQASKRYFNNRFLVSLGIRFDGNSYNSSMSAPFNQTSPRIAFSYNIIKDFSLNFGMGRYFQMPAFTTLGFRNTDNELANKEKTAYIGANHINIGLDKKFGDKILISAEGFYKAYFNYPIDQITGISLANQGADYSGIAGAGTYDFSGKGKAAGIEILNRLNFRTFKLLASYTFVKSLFTDIDGNYIPSSWDSKHLLTITGSKDLKKNWRVGFKWRFVGGLPYTPYDLLTSSYTKAWDTRGQAFLDYSQYNQLRLKNFHQLDVRIDKNFYFKKWTLMLYIDLQNAYNFKYMNQEIIVRVKNPDGTFETQDNGTRYVLKSVKNPSGTVLPTIGIMIKI